VVCWSRRPIKAGDFLLEKNNTMTRIIITLFAAVSFCITACESKIDHQTYFLSYIDKLPDSGISTSDVLSDEQKQVMKKYNLQVYIPRGFKSVIDNQDKECFIFYNPDENNRGLLLAKCFDSNSDVGKQIANSTKYNSPIYGPDYNDLSEFKHFKICEKIISDSSVGPFFFGGAHYEMLGAETVMHQFFLPKSTKYEFGEFTILYDSKKYLFICLLCSNGCVETIDNEEGISDSRKFAFQFL